MLHALSGYRVRSDSIYSGLEYAALKGCRVKRGMMMDRLRDMEVFVRVVETGSFSAAARHLKIGQPAISKAMAALEDRLGARLLVRSTRRLHPTEAGMVFYERAVRAIAEANEAEAAARGAGAGLEGRLRMRVRKISQAFEQALDLLFFENPKLAPLTRKYGVF